MQGRPRSKHVFINCPFDSTYKPTFEAIVFAIYFLGFTARCALEVDDASEVRLSKIVRIIKQCSYGIHDISTVGLGRSTRLPRFNMPLELGLYLGCKLFGTVAQQKKGCLILDSKPYRYRTFISDISGQDIHVHGGKPKPAIKEVRNWLASASKSKGLPGGAEVVERYAQFTKDLPKICKNLKRLPTDLTFADFSETVEIWLKSAR
ncbi:MAG: hypothetical protein WCC14_13640 [Acidobacteriaceae bacterium]